MNTIPDLIQLHGGGAGVRSLLEVEVREAISDAVSSAEAINEQPVLEFVASDGTLDRYQEVIEPAGWWLDTYRKNPVFQNAHNYGDILFTLGKALLTEVRAVGGRQALCQRIQFATEVNPVARIAYGLYRGGFLNAVSVGFVPVKWEDGTKGTDGPRRRYLEQELLEVSAVAIPANPDALALGVRSGAVEKADLKETIALLGALVAAPRETEEKLGTRWNASLPMMNFARELHRIIRA